MKAIKWKVGPTKARPHAVKLDSSSKIELNEIDVASITSDTSGNEQKKRYVNAEKRKQAHKFIFAIILNVKRYMLHVQC